MTRIQQLANALLWASAILCAALLGAPWFLTLVLLPCLGFAAVLLSRKPRGLAAGPRKACLG